MSIDSIFPEQLIGDNSSRAATDIFSRSIRMVEIEVFSYCNRHCWFCPNSFIDRRSINKLMDPKVYSSIIDSLASIQYRGMITFSRYNEPLSDLVILDRIAEAREKLPNATLHTNTNGDYLNMELLPMLYEAGLRSLNIQLYLANDEQYEHEAIKKKAAHTLRRLPLPSRVVVDNPGEWYQLELDYRDMSIKMYGRNFAINGTSRGNQLDINRGYVRTSPCLMPYWSVYIDFNGAVMPCCNLRSDIPSHVEYISGNLGGQESLFSIYDSHRSADFRVSLLNEEVKKGVCGNCHFALECVDDDYRFKMQEIHDGVRRLKES